MKSGITQREKAIEAKFHHDQELSFKIKSKRNKYFGLWLASHLGLKDHDAEAYARQIIGLALTCPDDTNLIEQIYQDLQGRQSALTIVQLEKQLQYCQEDARVEFMS